MRTATIFSKTIFLLFLAACFPALSQHPVLTKVSVPEGMNWIRIAGVAQDHKGFIWLASHNGLHRFDGYRYVSYYNEPDNKNSLAHNKTEAVAVTKKGLIIIGTHGGGLDIFDPTLKTFTHFTHKPDIPGSLSDNVVTAILEDRQGVLWVGTPGGLNRFHPQSKTFTRYHHNPNDSTSLSHDYVRTLYEDRKGTLWVGTGDPHNPSSTEGGLNRFHPISGIFTRYLHNSHEKNSLLNNKVRAIFEDSRGTFWIGTNGDGLHTMDREKGTFIRHYYDANQPDKLSRSPIQRKTSMDDGVSFIHEDVTRAIWIGTIGSGISRYDSQTDKVTHFAAYSDNNINGLQDNELVWAYNSKEGVLWIGSYGENFYKSDPFRVSFDYQKVGNYIYAFLEDAAGRILVGTDAGLKQYEVNEGKTRQVNFAVQLPDNLARDRVYSLLEDQRGNIWTGLVK